MLYRTMPKNGDKLSILGFGCMRLPRSGLGIDEQRAIKQIRYAIDHGVNYLDTALIYPGSEAVVGKALADGYREKVYLATKLPHIQVRKREDMDKLLDVQLQKLCTDHIDYYLMHSTGIDDWEKMKSLGAADFIAKAKADGRIRHIGFSTHAGSIEFKKIVDAYEWEFCQIQYNILDEKNQAGKEGLRYAASRGLGIIVMEPLRGGSLAKVPPKDIRAIWDEAEVKRSPAEWGLRWVWDQPEVTVVLSGMNEEAHIEENLHVAGDALPHSLTEKELRLVDRVKDAHRKRMKVGCTGCNYCMPCPAGVNIPGSFEYYNKLNLDNPLQAKLWYYVTLGGGMDGKGQKAFASRCIGCKKCVKVCTQHIDIPTQLGNAAKELESPGTKAMFFLMRPAMGAFMRFSRWSNVRKARKATKQ